MSHLYTQGMLQSFIIEPPDQDHHSWITDSITTSKHVIQLWFPIRVRRAQTGPLLFCKSSFADVTVKENERNADDPPAAENKTETISILTQGASSSLILIKAPMSECAGWY